MAVTSTIPLVRVEALTVTFPGRELPAVDNVSFAVHPGECVALVGESGSGKSLTARALLGLLPSSARHRGAISLGEDPAPANGSPAWTAIRGRRAALVPQDALGALDPLRRIELEVGDALRLHRLVPPSGRRERVVQALADAGMPTPEQQLRRRSDELSGGLRQRALVASALIAEPELIVADEPTTALDAGHRRRILGELRRRVREGAGLLLISHDLASVRDVADRVLVMRNGRVVEHGDPRTVFSTPAHPFTRELIAASPGGKPRGSRLLSTSTSTSAAHRAQPAPKPRLELRGIVTGFGTGSLRTPVLRHLTLEVNAGETVGLLGESGSGKTTLLRVALGLHRPEAGRVLIDGVDRGATSRADSRRMQRRIGLVPQDPLDSFPRGASGQSVLLNALRAAGVARAQRPHRASALASEVDLSPDLLHRDAATLSGGQRQRLAIARALAREPELLLLDEPVSALDVTVQARVLDLLDELQERRGTAYLLVSHDTDVVSHMSDRVLRLEKGTVSER